jgi:hypothetical protein
MSDLVDLAISTHGGMDRWRRLSTVSAHLRVGGALWALRDSRQKVRGRMETRKVTAPWQRTQQNLVATL